MKRQPKTQGLEWLYLSMASFNGSGYADKSSPETYLSSYRAYKRMKKDIYAIGATHMFEIEARAFSEKLVDAQDAGHIPSKKAMAKFQKWYDAEQLGLEL